MEVQISYNNDNNTGKRLNSRTNFHCIHTTMAAIAIKYILYSIQYTYKAYDHIAISINVMKGEFPLVNKKRISLIEEAWMRLMEKINL